MSQSINGRTERRTAGSICGPLAAERARAAWGALQTHFRTEDGRLRERIPLRPTDHPAAYLWGYAAALTAAAALVRMDPADGVLRADLRRLLDGLEEYWVPAAVKPPGAYRTTVRGIGEDERFYDDNAWVIAALLEAHRLLGEQRLLDRAVQLFEFLKSGADGALGGGVYWKEGDRSTKNTCSNGPAVVAALELREATGDAAYLDWAAPIYKWTRRNLQSPAGVYWDRIEHGRIERTTWTYNTGIMIQAAVLWHRATGDERELSEARRLAAASLAHFAPARRQGVPLFPPTPWFNSILYHGYAALHAADGDPAHLQALAAYLDLGWRRARDERGLVYHDWSKPVPENGEVALLDQAPVAELWARISVDLRG